MWIQKGFSTQTTLICLIEKWEFMLFNKGYIDAIAILMDLSKVFDTINHELLVAKPNAYRITKEALELILAT